MDSKDVERVMSELLAVFVQMSVGKTEHKHDESVRSPEWALEHCHHMLTEMHEMIQEGETDKSSRWLGFVQGVLWRDGVYTIAELRALNKPR